MPRGARGLRPPRRFAQALFFRRALRRRICLVLGQTRIDGRAGPALRHPPIEGQRLRRRHPRHPFVAHRVRGNGQETRQAEEAELPADPSSARTELLPVRVDVDDVLHGQARALGHRLDANGDPAHRAEDLPGAREALARDTLDERPACVALREPLELRAASPLRESAEGEITEKPQRSALELRDPPHLAGRLGDASGAGAAQRLVGAERSFEGGQLTDRPGEDERALHRHGGALPHVGRGGVGRVSDERDAPAMQRAGGRPIEELMVEDGVVLRRGEHPGHVEGVPCEALAEELPRVVGALRPHGLRHDRVPVQGLPRQLHHPEPIPTTKELTERPCVALRSPADAAIGRVPGVPERLGAEELLTHPRVDPIGSDEERSVHLRAVGETEPDAVGLLFEALARHPEANHPAR